MIYMLIKYLLNSYYFLYSYSTNKYRVAIRIEKSHEETERKMEGRTNSELI